ncbi:MAG TPA: Crp/Fnr family transcriptional regulator [Actinomycetota bacterium]|nr:Crp/Fnr family transcriptional regulator [Actinomycetota bacterium]
MHDPGSTVLDPLAPADRELLLGRAVARGLRPGETLSFAGEPPRRVHLVTGGVLKLVGRDVEGNQTILGLCLPGDLAGAAEALGGGPAPYDHVAAARSGVLGFDAALFAQVLGRNPVACVALVRALGGRVRWLCEAAQERSSANVPARLAGRLLDLAETIGRPHDGYVELELPFPQRDLGGLAGMCRESACRTLRRWKSHGTLDYEGRTLRIRRPEVLRAIRCAGRGATPSR